LLAIAIYLSSLRLSGEGLLGLIECDTNERRRYGWSASLCHITNEHTETFLGFLVGQPKQVRHKPPGVHRFGHDDDKLPLTQHDWQNLDDLAAVKRCIAQIIELSPEDADNAYDLVSLTR
jgi:hypothetical protein